MILLGNGLPVRAIFFHNLMTVTANRFQVSKPNDEETRCEVQEKISGPWMICRSGSSRSRAEPQATSSDAAHNTSRFVDPLLERLKDTHEKENEHQENQSVPGFGNIQLTLHSSLTETTNYIDSGPPSVQFLPRLMVIILRRRTVLDGIWESSPHFDSAFMAADLVDSNSWLLFIVVCPEKVQRWTNF